MKEIKNRKREIERQKEMGLTKKEDEEARKQEKEDDCDWKTWWKWKHWWWECLRETRNDKEFRMIVVILKFKILNEEKILVT